MIQKKSSLKEDLERALQEVVSLTYPAIAYDSYWQASLNLYKNDAFNYNENDKANSLKLLFLISNI
ncbi:MAG: hypothetical protein ACTHL3_01345 [Candidatus Nitrosocosmicus sp.]